MNKVQIEIVNEANEAEMSTKINQLKTNQYKANLSILQFKLNQLIDVMLYSVFCLRDNKSSNKIS